MRQVLRWGFNSVNQTIRNNWVFSFFSVIIGNYTFTLYVFFR